MNRTLEWKLRECLAEAEKQGTPDAFLVLHLLLGNYQAGSQRLFAQHCSQFSPISCRAAVADGEDALEDESEFPAEWDIQGFNDYLN